MTVATLHIRGVALAVPWGFFRSSVSFMRVLERASWVGKGSVGIRLASRRACTASLVSLDG